MSHRQPVLAEIGLRDPSVNSMGSCYCVSSLSDSVVFCGILSDREVTSISSLTGRFLFGIPSFSG